MNKESALLYVALAVGFCLGSVVSMVLVEAVFAWAHAHGTG